MTLLHPIPLLSMLTLLVACGDDAPLDRDASDASTGTCTQPHDLECLDRPVSSTGSTSSPGTGTGSGTETDGTSTGPECTDDNACTDSNAIFCGPQGQCVACDGTPDPHQACALRDPATPVCDRGTCVQCTPDQPPCDGATPVCGPDHACIACTEHDQCPDSACHLDGDLRGACFDPADVVMVADAMQLDAVFNEAGPGDQIVVLLTGEIYSGAVTDLIVDAEVALLGGGTASISGDRFGGLIGIGSSAILYIAGVSVRGNTLANGLSCSGTAVWLDDTEVRNNADAGIDISGGCAAHLRRTVVRANNSGGLIADSSPIFLVNSAVVENVDLQSIAGIRITGGELWASYSSIVANLTLMDPTDNMQCFGNPAGQIRNSIVVAPAGPSTSGCESIAWDNNAIDVDFGGSNVVVGYDAAWFDPAEGDVHLTPAGQTTFMDIALWQPGDPTADIDGDPIPTDLPSFPGYDQP